MNTIPTKGEVWKHTKTGGHYVILGSTFNTITDCVDIAYKPLYPCEYQQFNRQFRAHPKAWSSLNDDGTDRFVRVGRASTKHKMEWYYLPPERTI